MSLAAQHLDSVPFLRNPHTIDADAITPDIADQVLEVSFRRYFDTAGLFGTPARCIRMVDRLREIGVDEVACLIDYGVDADTVLSALENLDQVHVQAAD